MKYYAISLDISELMNLDVLVDEFITYAQITEFNPPNNFILAEQLAEYSYCTFGEFYAKTDKRVIAFVMLKDKTPEQLGFKNYFELPKKISSYKLDPRIDTILLEFED